MVMEQKNSYINIREHTLITYVSREGGRITTKAYDFVRRGREGQTTMCTQFGTHTKNLNFISKTLIYFRNNIRSFSINYTDMQ